MINRFFFPQKHSQPLVTACVLGMGLLSTAGCSPSADPGLEQLRREIITDNLPKGVLSLAEANAAFEEGMTLQVVGRIFANGMSPFDPGSAAFNLIELPKPGHSHDDPNDCPFCKREMENAATAIVQILDESGEIVQMSAEKLLKLEKNQDVVVAGQASKVGEILIVNATSLHVLDSDNALLLAKQIHEKLED